ncbi:uncharacterized protein LOC115632787 [Scaptodrosophila lebanonensis]|uniref:Uncharacterized protein LOC115632787 n=1 Tax=Drosophila lebanonensis TaxID=7225 RepID=A0A6J2UBY9_DROLE|nr:uncharacterized protein LOC115632787 [Scaptodrosophila lebanonensis]
MPSIASTTYATANDARLSYVVNQAVDFDSSAPSTATATASASASASSSGSGSASTSGFPTFSPPRIESLVASSAEDLSSFRDVTFDIFDDADDLYGSPLAFDASEHGLWNGRFVPPPPRPPFFVDEPVLTDGLTTCDLCSWAMPTKSTFIFEGTIEKATELGWPLTLIIVSVLSALFGAIIMIAVVRCRRKKSSNNRNDTHVQWWSRNKRPHGSSLGVAGSGVGGGIAGNSGHHNNNNHLRRSNIYTAHPADSIRGLPQPTLSASSSLTAMSTMMATAPPAPTIQQQQPQRPSLYPHDCNDAYEEEEHEYHQPQELQLQLQLQLQHQRQHSSSMSSVTSSPSLMLNSHHHHHHHQQPMLPPPPPPPVQPSSSDSCHWPQPTTMVVAS